MRWLDKLRLTYQSIFRRGRVDQELDTELQFFLDQETEKHIAAGLTPRDATKAAQRTLGNLTRVKEACRDQRRLGLLDDGVQDVPGVLMWSSQHSNRCVVRKQWRCWDGRSTYSRCAADARRTTRCTSAHQWRLQF